MSKSVCSKKAGRTRLFFGVVTMVSVVLTLGLAGCGGGDEGGGDITNKSDEAWVFCETYEDEGVSVEGCEGMAFHGGKVYMVGNSGGFNEEFQEFLGDAWLKMEIGTYSTKGGKLTISGVDPEDGTPFTETGTYSVSGNKLTLGSGKDSETFTLRTGLKFVNMEDFEDIFREFVGEMCKAMVDADNYPGTVEECVEELMDEWGGDSEFGFKRREAPRNRLLKPFKGK